MVSYNPAICSTVYCSMTSFFMSIIFTILAYFTDEELLKQKTTKELNQAMKSSDYDVRVYYSARGILRLVLEKIYLSNPSNKQTLTIGCNSIHAKPMQKAIKSFEKDHPGCEIRYIFINMNSKYSFDHIPNDLANCDILILYHLWGFVYDYDKIIQVANDANILVFEDLVQGGGMVPHSKDPYLGHKGSDVIVWSGAADKTISTIGNGFFIDKSEFLTETFIDQHSNGRQSSSERLEKLLWSLLVLIVLRNPLHLFGIFITMIHKLGYNVLDTTNWLLSNRGKSFDHAVTIAKPSLAALYSVRFTLWMDDYTRIERQDKEKLKLFLQNLSHDVWESFFPHHANRSSDKTDYFMKGISEFFYCFDPYGKLQSFMDKQGFICVQQQSWMAFQNDRPESSEQILLDGMLLLPNFHNMRNNEIARLAGLLNEYYRVSKEKTD